MPYDGGVSRFSRRTGWDLTESSFASALRQARASARRLWDLTISNPTRCGFDYDADALLPPLTGLQALSYNPDPRGLVNARAAVARYYSAHHAEVGLDDLLLTTSTSESYSYLFRLLCDPGDEVLVPQPGYPLFDFLADLEDVKLVPYPLLYDHGWQIDFHSLEKVLGRATRGIVLVNPNNPTGSYVNAFERDRLNEICRRHNLALIVDEVFLDYSLDGSEHGSFATNEAVITFTLSGLSKISVLL